jgi:hypothetical protein
MTAGARSSYRLGSMANEADSENVAKEADDEKGENAAKDDEKGESAAKEDAEGASGAAEASASSEAEEAAPAEAGSAKVKPPPKGQAWADPIARFEAAWTRLDTKLITWVLIAQLLSMVAWVLLSGLSSPIQSGNASGLVMRGVLGAVGLGLGAHFATRKSSTLANSLAVLAAIAVGIVIAPKWRTVGVEYFDNVKAWLQEGSTLTLMGGLRGVATRLTLWLALLGGSLATASGKHINIDVIFRFVPARVRLPIAVVNYCTAALVCLGAVWGFFDHIAIESHGAKADDSAGTKISTSMHRMGDHFFLARKQISLDLKSFPHIVKGDRFDRWMAPKEWNDWVKDSGFDGRYPKELVDTIVVPEDAPPHTPLVLAPDGESTRGLLVHDLSLVFPFGMLVLALRFLLRAILSISGHIEVDPNAAHKEEIGQHTAQAATEKGGV